MPNRILREGILTSERVAKLSWPAEVFYRRLMSVVDDFGRYYAKPELLRSAAYPLVPDKVGNSDVRKWLDECSSAALVRTYTCDGKQFLELQDFRQQVRAKESRFPAPPSESMADANQMRSTCAANEHLDVDVFGVEDVGETTSPEPAQKPRRSVPAKRWNGETVCMLPVVGHDEPEIAITRDFVDEMQPAYPAVDCDATLLEIRAWCLANPKKLKTPGGVYRFVQTWFAREQNRG